MLVRFNGVSKSFGSLEVLRDVSFGIRAGEKVGLIGANGAGKSTVLDLIQRPEETDRGSVERRSKLRVGYLDQIPEFGPRTALEEALGSFAHLRELEGRLRKAEAAMAESGDGSVLQEYSALLDRFEAQGGYSYPARAEAALFGLGFRHEQLRQPAGTLSGGEQNRLALARLLLAEFDLFLLDEPTNHLDIRAIAWLEQFLSRTERAVLLVSHDRFFLDRTVTRVLELEDGKISSFSGNYSHYLDERTERRRSQEKAWQQQQDWIKRNEEYIRRNIAGQKTKQAQSRRKALARLERVARPSSEADRPRFRFGPAPAVGREVLRAAELSFGYKEGRVLGKLSFHVERGERWAVAGPNGSGKTTLLKTLIGRLDALAGDVTLDDRVEIGYYDQHLQDLDPERTVLEEIQRAAPKATDGELRSFLAAFLFRGEAVFQPVRNLSGGERSRLTLARIIRSGPPLLALDEPTNHLDIASREALEMALAEYPGTLLFVTHDRRLIERLATHILYLGPPSARVFHRFDEFENWLDLDLAPAAPERAAREAEPPGREQRPSKNRRRASERRIAQLEAAIEAGERQIQEIEAAFQSAPDDTEWESAGRRHAELRESIDALYTELAELDVGE